MEKLLRGKRCSARAAGVGVSVRVGNGFARPFDFLGVALHVVGAAQFFKQLVFFLAWTIAEVLKEIPDAALLVRRPQAAQFLAFFV